MAYGDAGKMSEGMPQIRMAAARKTGVWTPWPENRYEVPEEEEKMMMIMKKKRYVSTIGQCILLMQLMRFVWTHPHPRHTESYSHYSLFFDSPFHRTTTSEKPPSRFYFNESKNFVRKNITRIKHTNFNFDNQDSVLRPVATGFKNNKQITNCFQLEDSFVSKEAQ